VCANADDPRATGGEAGTGVPSTRQRTWDQPFGPDNFGGEAPPPGFEIVWRAFQKRIAQMSTNSRLVIAKRAGHVIPRDQPRIVAEAIRQVVMAVRRNAKLRACKQTFPRLGGRCLSVRP
jgi:hypothetical protein